MNKKRQAFTLVELIVVVTILAILSTIGFVSYSSYLTWVRDTNRTSNLKAIFDGMEMYRANYSLPLPDSRIDIKSNWTIVAYQWYAWANVLESIEFSNNWKDPKDDIYYSYYLTKDKKYFQLMWFLEEEDNLPIVWILDKTNALDYSIRYPVTFGHKLGIITDMNNKPLQEMSEIISSWSIDISNIWDIELKSFLKHWEYVTWTWVLFEEIININKDGGKFWLVHENEFTYYDPNAEWPEYDPNCDIEDIRLWTQTWAWCNSTLWDWVEYVRTQNTSCYEYSGTETTCSDSQNLSSAKENAFFTWVNSNWDEAVDNIWWKMYNGVVKASACPFWRHLPSDDEWLVLEELLWCTDYNLNAVYRCAWMGAQFHTTQTLTGNLIEELKLPLAGRIDTDGVTFLQRGYVGRYLTSETAWYSSIRSFEFHLNKVGRADMDIDYSYSARCIKGFEE